MPEIEGGAVFWARQTIESEIFFKKPDKWFKIWFYMVMKAQWRDKRGLRRGQCHLKYEWIMDATGAKRDEVSNCIRWLKRTTQITTQKTTRGFILTICNYEKFQDLRNYINNTENDTENETETTQKRHRNDTILKKEKKENKEKKERKKERFILPTLKEVEAYCQDRKNKINPQVFHNWNTSKGWMVGKNKMVDWKAAVRTWEQRDKDEAPVESDIGKTICRDCKQPPGDGFLQDGVCDKCREGSNGKR